MIEATILDEIRARVPVSEIVGRRVRLRRDGREWKGLSPFNKERSPSFCVNDQKRFWHDFSSGKHGDIFTFVMEMEGRTFPQAVEELAAMGGFVAGNTLQCGDHAGAAADRRGGGSGSDGSFRSG
jgi:DNA primase